MLAPRSACSSTACAALDGERASASAAADAVCGALSAPPKKSNAAGVLDKPQGGEQRLALVIRRALRLAHQRRRKLGNDRAAAELERGFCASLVG